MDSKNKSAATTTTLLLAICVIAATCVAGHAQDSRAKHSNATVIADPLPVYSRMSSSGKVVTSLKKGDRVTVDFELSGAGEAWCSLTGLGGSAGTGYVPCKGLERDPRAPIQAGPLAQVIEVGRAPGSRPMDNNRRQLQAKAAAGGAGPFAPDFNLTQLDGQRLSLADYKGKVVLLDFWATWCGPCRSQIPGFVDLQSRYGNEGFTVIGISVDDAGPEAVKQFYGRFRMNYPVAMTDHRVGQLYGGVPGLPTTFLIGRDGRIYSREVGAAPASSFESKIKTLLAAD